MHVRGLTRPVPGSQMEHGHPPRCSIMDPSTCRLSPLSLSPPPYPTPTPHVAP